MEAAGKKAGWLTGGSPGEGEGGWSLQVGTGTPVHVNDCEAEGSEAGRGASLSAWERWGEGQQQI